MDSSKFNNFSFNDSNEPTHGPSQKQSSEEMDPMNEAAGFELAKAPTNSSVESSLIFERSVEDPSQVYQQTVCPRCGQNSAKSPCKHQSIVNLPSHYSMENFTAPCLDATATLLNDDSADLDNVEMVYSSRSSSVIGLNMALGRTTSINSQSSSSNIRDLNTGGGPTSPNLASASVSSPVSGSNPRPSLNFYSYADMISSENPNPRRPSISQSLSSSFIRSNSFRNPSMTPQRNIRANSSSFINANSATPSSRVPVKKSFTLSPDSPNCSDSESEYGLSRTNSMHSAASSAFLGGPAQRRFSNLDDALYNEDDDCVSLVSSSIGEQIRRNTGEIRSSNSSIIA